MVAKASLVVRYSPAQDKVSHPVAGRPELYFAQREIGLLDRRSGKVLLSLCERARRGPPCRISSLCCNAWSWIEQLQEQRLRHL
jgi:hypothetical protein